MTTLIDIAGQQFGRLRVISREGTSSSRKTLWLCECACGNTALVTSNQLRRGRTNSCGCLRHGYTKTPTYNAWCGAKKRCCNTQDKDYKNYGGRGIRVCARWLESFENFLKDMGERPAGKSLDRIDVDGDYELSNCRWATASEQAQNRRPRFRRDQLLAAAAFEDRAAVLRAFAAAEAVA